jgi:hypothetical protein
MADYMNNRNTNAQMGDSKLLMTSALIYLGSFAKGKKEGSVSINS